MGEIQGQRPDAKESGVTYRLNGKTVSREEFTAGARRDWLQGAPMAANTYREHDPLISEGLGCMKSQVPEMRKMLKEEGIQGVSILDSGQARITSRRGRNALIKKLSEFHNVNLHDMDGGFGDA